METTAEDDTPRCQSCRSRLWDDELGFVCCRLCVDRVDDLLALLPGERGLFARINATGALLPGSGRGGSPVTGSRTPPLPLRLEPLSLAARGGVLTVLQTWLIDWHDVLNFGHPRFEGGPQRQLDHTVKQLRANLGWCMEAHPAAGEFAGEVRYLVQACQTALDPASRPPTVRIGPCPADTGDGPCRGTLTVRGENAPARCGRCSAVWGREAFGALRDQQEALGAQEGAAA